MKFLPVADIKKKDYAPATHFEIMCVAKITRGQSVPNETLLVYLHK